MVLQIKFSAGGALLFLVAGLFAPLRAMGQAEEVEEIKKSPTKQPDVIDLSVRMSDKGSVAIEYLKGAKAIMDSGEPKELGPAGSARITTASAPEHNLILIFKDGRCQVPVDKKTFGSGKVSVLVTLKEKGGNCVLVK